MTHILSASKIFAFMHVGGVLGARIAEKRANQTRVSGASGDQKGKTIGDWNMLPELAEGPVREFINEHYAEDFRLVERVTAEFATAAAPDAAKAQNKGT